MSDDDLAERVPTGGQTRFDNRLAWAISYLRRADLLETPSRGQRQITERGRSLLETHQGGIGIRQLRAMIDGAKPDSGDPPDEDPEDQVARLHGEMEAKLADDLLDRVRNLAPHNFEKLALRLLEKMGYGEGEVVGRSGDQGIDVIIDQDPLGLEKVYVQAKRWRSPVNEPEIRNFSGSLSAKGSNKGVFVTTSVFAPKARETARLISAGNQFIRLIDGAELARLMIAHGVGVVVETTYEVKKLDENYLGGGET